MNNIVLITWARGWLWQELVKTFLKNNYYVLAWVRSEDFNDDSLNKNNNTSNKNLEYIKLDVTNQKEIESVLKYSKKIWDLKIVINNAAISGWWKIWDRDIEEEKNIYNVNFFAPINILKLSNNLLEKNEWLIVNISSISANVPVPFISTYSSSKAALENFMLWAFLENKKTKIRCLNLKLWPLNRWLCWSSLPYESSKYKAWVKNHLSKIQKIHWYPVEKVWNYIIKFIDSNKNIKLKLYDYGQI